MNALILSLLVLLAPLKIAQAQALVKGCAVEARAYQILHEAGAWTHLIRLEYGNEKDGHAVCVFALANNDIWFYDCNKGSNKLDTKSKAIADLTKALGEYFDRIRCAKFMDE